MSFKMSWLMFVVVTACQSVVPQEQPKNISQIKNNNVPTDVQICFTPDKNQTCKNELLQLLNSTTASLDIAVYAINLDSVVNVIINKAGGLPVRMVVDSLQSSSNPCVLKLIKAGVKIKTPPRKPSSAIMHNKFTIVDHNKVETGSFNYTHNASENSYENQVYLSHPNIVSQYKKYFEEMWEKSSELTADKIKVLIDKKTNEPEVCE